jgi:quercetin dioxygenase-like cupin family protein
MRKMTQALALVLVMGGVFVGGVAVGDKLKTAKFVTKDEVKWVDLGGIKLGVLSGDKDKGPYIGLMQLPAGFESSWHSHTGDYESVQIQGTSRHWMKGEDGAKAKKMTPGSYWWMPANVDHISACDKGSDCLLALIQKTKFDAVPGKDAATPAKPPTPTKSATSATPAKSSAPPK